MPVRRLASKAIDRIPWTRAGELTPVIPSDSVLPITGGDNRLTLRPGWDVLVGDVEEADDST